jgi:hypothetical protein
MESSAGFTPAFTLSNFWRFGNTFVTSQIRRFNSPTVSSAHTRTVYSFPDHFTAIVISSTLAGLLDDVLSDAISPPVLLPFDLSTFSSQFPSQMLTPTHPKSTILLARKQNSGPRQRKLQCKM